jgi:uncharacterized membrane protein YdbT with pleckstrin-like domain
MHGPMIQIEIKETSVAASPGRAFEADGLVLEPAVIDAQLHWIVFAAPVAWLAASVVLLMSGIIFEILGLFALILAVGAIACAYCNYASSSFSIRGGRLLVTTGLIQRDMLEIALDSIEGIEVRQNFAGRLLGFGTIVVSDKEGWQHRYHRIPTSSSFWMQVKRLGS